MNKSKINNHSDKEFNLLKEPWIKVLDTIDENVSTESLLNVLLNAKKYECLAGESSIQDTSILRMLLAVLQTVVYRYDIDGNYKPLTTPDEALERWKTIWDKEEFPKEMISAYLSRPKIEDRFYLFHPEYPFYQHNCVYAVNTAYLSASKLDMSTSQSQNTPRAYSRKVEDAMVALSYDEAARWLITINYFDDAALKARRNERQMFNGKSINSPTIRVGWCGEFTPVYLELACNARTQTRKTLFTTLMLNLVLLNYDGTLWDSPTPSWEESLDSSYNTSSNIVGRWVTITNQAQLLSLQSRRTILYRDANKHVVAYKIALGDVIERRNGSQWFEQMGTSRGSGDYRKMVKCQTSVTWQELNRFLGVKTSESPALQVHRLGALHWLDRLCALQMINKEYCIDLHTVHIEYHESQSSSIVDVQDSRIPLNPCTYKISFSNKEPDKIENWETLLRSHELGTCDESLLDRLMNDEIGKCTIMLKAFYALEEGVLKSTVANPDDIKFKPKISLQYGYAIHREMRRWLFELQGDENVLKNVEKHKQNWQKRALRIALETKDMIIMKATPRAIVGCGKYSDKYNVAKFSHNFNQTLYTQYPQDK